MKTSALGKKINPCKKGLSLLDPINRQKDDIKYGIDIWNVYDFMYLNHNKIPQLVVLEIVIPYESDLIIESKSLKLYLNEFYKKSFSNKEVLIKKIKNAGSIFIGKFSPEAMGDYIAGPNHVLPTSGSAKFSSGLSVNDFLKRHSLIKITKTGIERLGPSVINLAKYENLDGHARSIKVRLKKGKLFG